MTAISPVPGVEVDFEPDTEDITIPALDAAADDWERMVDVYAAGDICPGCMWYESGINMFSGTRYRECSCLDARACPGVNPRSAAAALRRQAE